MNLYRISKQKYIKDLSGEGARRYGGRWNRRNFSVLYTSQTESLSVLETLVHVSVSAFPSDLSLLILSIPDNVSLMRIDKTELPNSWRNYPAPNSLAEAGTKWIESNTSLLLEVPSVLVKTEKNFLINPSHPEIDKITINEIRPIIFDKRFYHSV